MTEAGWRALPDSIYEARLGPNDVRLKSEVFTAICTRENRNYSMSASIPKSDLLGLPSETLRDSENRLTHFVHFTVLFEADGALKDLRFINFHF